MSFVSIKFNFKKQKCNVGHINALWVWSVFFFFFAWDFCLEYTVTETLKKLAETCFTNFSIKPIKILNMSHFTFYKFRNLLSQALIINRVLWTSLERKNVGRLEVSNFQKLWLFVREKLFETWLGNGNH